MNRMLKVIIGITTGLFTVSCSNLLPTVKQTTDSQWVSYEDAKRSFDRIMPGKTTVAELKSLGFDPFEKPNIRLLNYLEITELFIPNASIQLVDLHPDIQTCLKAKSACQAYEIAPKDINSLRYGNVLLDVFNFRKKTRTTGWKFQGLIVLNDNLVVYKLEGGQPNILELEDKENPLGPFQNISIDPNISI
ncbi:MAG: hypothetical protein QG599_1391 [Pseudomonadota bacterium]|nr:hypothetical protein [Pseudomonadota bacterium]